MFKKVFSMVLASAALLLFASCGASGSSSAVVNENSGVASESDSVTDDISAPDDISVPDENEALAVGDSISTYFFVFTVESAETVDTYAGYTPKEGYKLVDVVINTINTFGDTFEMKNSDYQLQWNGREEQVNSLAALDDTMAPAAHNLPDSESVTFHYVFEVPADVTEFELRLVEEVQGEGDQTEATYFVAFTA